MKTIKIIFIICAFAVIFLSCEKDKNKDIKEIKLTTKQQQLVESGNAFSFNILKAVSENQDNTENFMISPLSINLALAMTANGAKNNTLSQMLDVLGFENTDLNEFFKLLASELTSIDSKIEISIANSIWYRNSFTVLQEFLDRNQEYYNAEISPLDFSSPSAVSTINNWVANATNQKITEIIEGIGGDVVMYLINAIYFYGEWKYEFDKSKTVNENFYLADNSTVSVPMMKMEANLKYFSHTNAKILELPYGRGNFVMNIIFPESNSTPNEVLSELNSEKWNEWYEAMIPTEVVLTMPKFKFEFQKSLNEILYALGMEDIFIPNLADLSGINGTGNLYVSDVKHKTFIDVNEEGTEAAAVTSVEITFTSMPAEPSPIFITIDKPFIFLIREVSTKSILFSGIVADPSKE